MARRKKRLNNTARNNIEHFSMQKFHKKKKKVSENHKRWPIVAQQQQRQPVCVGIRLLMMC